MKKVAAILAIVIILAGQFALVVPALFREDSFRRQERAEAHKAMIEHPSPDTKAAFEREMELARHHNNREQLMRGILYFGVLVLLEGVGYYLLIYYGKRRSA